MTLQRLCFIETIRTECEDELRKVLSNYNPGIATEAPRMQPDAKDSSHQGGATGISSPRSIRAKCNRDFDFSALPNLHMASFLIIPGEGDSAPALCFEGTFDGERTRFVHDLVQACSEGVRHTFGACIGCPDPNEAAAEIIVRYILDRHVDANLSFSGAPGRPVSRILGEQDLRDAAVDYVKTYRSFMVTAPSSYEAILEDILANVVRRGTGTGTHTDFRWAEEIPATAFRVKHGRLALFAAAAAAVVFLALILKWALDLFGILSSETLIQLAQDWPSIVKASAGAFKNQLDWIYGAFDGTGLLIAAVVFGASGFLLDRLGTARPTGGVMKSPVLQAKLLFYCLLFFVFFGFSTSWATHASIQAGGFAPLGLIATLAVWLIARWIGFTVEIVFPDPRSRDYYPEILLLVTRFVARAASVALIVLVIDYVLRIGAQDVYNLRYLGTWLVGDNTAYPISVGALALLAAIASYFWLGYLRSTLLLPLETRFLLPTEKVLLSLKLHFIKVLRILVMTFVGLHLAFLILPSTWTDAPLSANLLLSHAIPFGVYILFAIIFLFLIFLLIIVWMRFCETSDLRRYDHPKRLLLRPKELARATAREEHGINLLQNHLASVTHVKPGVLRLYFLRFTLFVINLLSHYVFTRGTLGGIPTILHAQWTLINEGRRLLFLVSYCGSWESYLNEFIDLGAVWGVNSIWTHTHLRPEPESQVIGFSPTRGILFGGAQDARPFKAYVRNSQIETLVWYSAYPGINTTNINNNSRFREGLLKPQRTETASTLLRNI